VPDIHRNSTPGGREIFERESQDVLTIPVLPSDTAALPLELTPPEAEIGIGKLHPEGSCADRATLERLHQDFSKDDDR
jgi:hypothetical protein